MEIINQNLGCQKNKRKMIAAMGKYNPYKIKCFTESIYDKIIIKRQTIEESTNKNIKNIRDIYLPPVISEEGMRKPKKVNKKIRFNLSSHQNSRNSLEKIKIESANSLSKSLELQNFTSTKAKASFCSKTLQLTLRRNSEASSTERRTKSVMKKRESSFKPLSSLHSHKSPWAFQGLRYFHLSLSK